jgi:hypothetical protein
MPALDPGGDHGDADGQREHEKQQTGPLLEAEQHSAQRLAQHVPVGDDGKGDEAHGHHAQAVHHQVGQAEKEYLSLGAREVARIQEALDAESVGFHGKAMSGVGFRNRMCWWCVR